MFQQKLSRQKCHFKSTRQNKQQKDKFDGREFNVVFSFFSLLIDIRRDLYYNLGKRQKKKGE